MKMAQKITQDFIPFEEEQKVWLDTENLNMKYLSSKLKPKKTGPFKIIKKLGKLVYKLVLPKSWRIHPVFYTTLLKLLVEAEAHGPNFVQPPLELVEGEEEYKVETILRHKKQKNGRYLYMVKWKGYSISEASWEPISNLKNAREILEEYKLAHSIPL